VRLAPEGFVTLPDPRGITHEGHRAQLLDFLQAIDSGGKPLIETFESDWAAHTAREFVRLPTSADSASGKVA